MCKKYLSNSTIAVFMANLLYRQGIKYICISPGSRNTPLTKAFIEHDKMTCISQVDERSSAYFGLGLAKTSKSPVAVLTTSGTATANLLPAITEASLNQIPLIVLTADRPLRLLNTGESQTINQINIYGQYVRAMLDIDPAKQSVHNLFDKLNKIFLQHIEPNDESPSGPIHINFRFDEPLIDKKGKLPNFTPYKKIPQKKYSRIKLPKYGNALIICGPLKNKDKIESIITLSKKINAPIFADSLSQMRYGPVGESTNVYYDLYIDLIKIKPDIILRFGQKPISKKLNTFLKENKKITYLIDEHPYFNDDIKNQIQSNLSNLDSIKAPTLKSNGFLEHITLLERKLSKNIQKLKPKYNSQAHLLENCLNIVKKGDCIFIGSSTIIRTFDQFSGKSKKDLSLQSNHLTRGIDGTVSTALGMAYINKKSNNYLFIGDLSFFYDNNGFNLVNHNPINLTVIVINNKGGQIFSRLPYADQNIKEFNKFWITPVKTKIKDVARLYKLNYHKSSINRIKKDLEKIGSKKGVNIIEVEIQNQSDLNFINKVEKLV